MKPPKREGTPPGRDTLLLHTDEHLKTDGAVVPAIHQSTTFRGNGAAEFLAMATGTRHPRFYARYGNPTNAHAESVIAALEGAESAVLTASGMAAISTAILALVSAGDHVILQTNHYGGITALGRDVLSRLGIDVTTVDQRSPAAYAEAIRPNTRLVVLESPSNPVLHLTDLGAVARIARDAGAMTLADNTFATPVNQRPLELGVDLVFHSATKYLGGHSDLLAGAIAGRAELVEQIWKASLVLGSVLGPFDAWLLLRGLRTLGVRMDRHNQSALSVARFLERHPAVRVVHYPGLESHPQHALATRQMTAAGGVLSVELEGGLAAAERFLSRLHWFARAASVGGVESLAVRPAAMMAPNLSEAELATMGISPDLIRLSVGLENEADLIADLDHALSE